MSGFLADFTDALRSLDAGVFIAIVALLGLLVGSFLNVVIHRLPLMMQAQWDAECAQYLAGQAQESDAGGDASDDAVCHANKDAIAAPAGLSLSLSHPASHCPSCGHGIRWFENIPVVSWLLLRGQCSSCKGYISVRYPMVEVATACLFGWCAWRWGITATTLAWCGFSATLLALALIDWDTTFLPDSLTLPLLWGGLLAASMGLTALPLHDAVWGAVGGYLVLWSIYWAFRLLTGREGMGHGDFKLLAALGAWLGWQALLPVLVLSSVMGAVVGLVLKFRQSLREGGYVPFGPFLAGAAFVVLFSGPDAVLRAILSLLGQSAGL